MKAPLAAVLRQRLEIELGAMYLTTPKPGEIDDAALERLAFALADEAEAWMKHD
jgi:hypothetical protein